MINKFIRNKTKMECFSYHKTNNLLQMKFFISIVCLVLSMNTNAQSSEDFIPRDAVTVFSINNITLLQKISLDDLVQYEFMEEVQTELFDGSTSGKTLKDSGIDFEQKLNVFYGKGDEHEVSGFTFGIKNKSQLFTVFDDFDKIESSIPGVEFYTSLSNHLIIKGNVGILMRVEPLMEKVIEYTDSIWYARGNESPWNYDEYDGEVLDNSEELLNEKEIIDEEMDSIAGEIERDEIDENKEDYPLATEDPNQKNYSELQDSVLLIFQKLYLDQICNDLLVKGNNLKKADSKFAEQLTHKTEGIFFMDNSRNLKKAQGFWYFQSMFPGLFTEVNELYTGNVIVGDLILNTNSIELKMQANYGEELGSIYEKLNNSKFDKSVLKYIHKANPAHFTYNVNLREAYEQSLKVIIPILEKQKDARVSSTLLTIELLNDFVNKDALFGAYKGSMFGTFNGIKKVKTKKIEYVYDEETFEFSDSVVEGEEDMPLFVFGISTDRPDIPEKILRHLSRLTSQCKNYGKYWKFENAILESVPLYMINRNGLFIFTNDEDLALNHPDGYGSNALSGKEAKEMKKSGFIYGRIDWSKAIERLPREMFTSEQNDILDAMREKTGIMELNSSKATSRKTEFEIIYNFSDQYGNSGKYILDLVNSIYVLTK